MDDLAGRLQERLAALKAERERRFVELAQYDAVIAELEQLLQPAAAEPKSEIISDLLPAPAEPPALVSPNGAAAPA